MKRKNEKAFTLIELLAVIVILAIIALIATPIILGIVEDARKDAFLRSVELIISSTDLDVMNKLTDTGYEYKLVDGKIGDIKTFDKYEITNKDTCMSYYAFYPTAVAEKLCENEDITLEEYINLSVQEMTEEEVASNALISGLTNAGALAKNAEGKYEIVDVDACATFYAPVMPKEYGIKICSEIYLDRITKQEIPDNIGKEPNAYYAVNELLNQEILSVKYSYNDLNLAKNTEGMNGTIKYNSDGKEVYAIHNGNYCVIKNSNMERAEVINYEDGNCHFDLTMTFDEFINNAAGGDKATSGDGQLVNLGEYGIRYQGTNPNNYVYFNCSDYSNQNLDTCELWRIIGVVDGKIKLIKTESIGKNIWKKRVCDENGSNCETINDWTTSDMQTYLNEEYYSILTAETQSLISPSTWYLRAIEDYKKAKDEMYRLERTSGIILHETSSITNMNIGLMYPSDYGFAAQEKTSCFSTTFLARYSETCIQSSWLYLGSSEWLLNPYFSSGGFIRYASFIGEEGSLGGEVYHYVSESLETRPTLYLRDNIIIKVGDGTIEKPYQISY